MNHFNISVAVKLHHDNKRATPCKIVKSLSFSVCYKGTLLVFIFCYAKQRRTQTLSDIQDGAFL